MKTSAVKIIGKAAFIASVVLWAWGFASFFDVVAHNSDRDNPDYMDYASWNVINLFWEEAK